MKVIMTVTLGLLIAAAIGLTGCEDTTQQNVQIFIYPPSYTYSGSSASPLTLKALTEDPARFEEIEDDGDLLFSDVTNNVALFLPLEWTVSDPSLGTIIGSESSLAIYQPAPDAYGNNVITVRDQAGASGIAVIYQEP